MAQGLFWNMQGGVTGAASGHHVYFYDDIGVDAILSDVKSKGHTHAMVCKIGMLISGFGDQVNIKTPIQNFYEFAKTDEFMRAHIIATPNKKATIHPQHLEINLDIWNGESVTDFGTSYTRCKDNVHDDYTPWWIDTEHHPRINNFTAEQRTEKNFLYPDRDYEKHEKIFYDFLKNGVITSTLIGYDSSTLLIKHAMRRRKRYYFENNEVLPSHLDTKYDVIIAPTAGLMPEFLYDKYGHEDTKVIIFDYDPLFLEVKKHIIEWGFVGEDLLYYMEHLSNKYSSDHDYVFSCGRSPNQASAFIGNTDIIKDATRVIDKLAEADYEMRQVDMLSDDFEWVESLVEGKSVLCYVSNIFKYYAVWLSHDANDIINQYNKLDKSMASASSYKIFGRSWQ